MATLATETSEWTAERALALSTTDILELFETLSAPAFSELDGEYTGHAHMGDTEESRRQVTAVMYDENSVQGYWLGKAYKPTGDDVGEGYNHWRRSGGAVERNLRFGTHMGDSRLDGRPALIMTYASFDNRSGAVDLVDEIRKLGDGLYLGAATVQKPDGTRSKPGCFVLVGPIGSWVGVDDEAAEQR